MDPTLAANLLLIATIGVFVFLTLLAFLMNEGKPIIVDPLKRRLRKKFGRKEVFHDENLINANGGGDSGHAEDSF